jgi:hypothetical protein
MALCVCSVLAAWRCLICDTPICEQHRNRFWPGQGWNNVRLSNDDERVVWHEAANASPSIVRFGAHEACTVVGVP